MRLIYGFLSSTFLAHIVWLIWLLGMPFSKAISSSALGTLFGLAALTVLVKGPSNVLKGIGKDITPTHYRAILLWGMLWVAYLGGMFYTENLTAGGLFLWKQIPLLLMPCVLVFYYKHLKTSLKTYLWAFTAANLTAGCLTLFFYALSDDTVAYLAQNIGLMPFEKGLDRAYFGLYSPFIERIQFANLLGMALLATAWLCYESTTSKARWATVLAMFVLFFCMLILGGRGSLLGAIAGLGVWSIGGLYYYSNNFSSSFFVKKINRQIAFATACILIWLALFSVPYLAIKHIEPVKKRYEQLWWELQTYRDGTFKQYDYVQFTSLRRLLSWQKHAQLIQKNTVLGVGTGDYRHELQQLYDQDKLGFPANAHHQLLQIWATIGLWGLIVFGAIGLYWLRAVQAQKNIGNTLWAWAFVAFYSILFMTDSALSSQLGLTVFVLFVGLIALDKNKG